jgi:opacity protein-like surface antigen
MRLSTAAALAIALPFAASAADMDQLPTPVLRGALPASDSIDWSGVYAGAFWSFGASNASGNSTYSMNTALDSMTQGTQINRSIRSQGIIETGRGQDMSLGFGVFAGYNFVFDDAVFGVEVDYKRSKLTSGFDGVGSGTTPGYAVGSATQFDSWSANTRSNIKFTDLATLRARMGYAFGNWMPYLTAGFALGRASTLSGATISGSFQRLDASGVQIASGIISFPPLNTSPSSLTTQTRTKFYGGYSLGAGLDFALSSNIFVRAELQHLRFANIAGSNIAVNSARVGAAVKF